MPKVVFPFRFIVDYDFFEKVMKPNSGLFMAMMYISSCSIKFRRRHNLMSEKVRDRILEENKDYGQEYIKSSLNKVSEPSEIEDVDDEVIRNIKYAVYYANELEHSEDNITKICILTSDDKKGEYIENEHLKGVKNVSIRSGEEAIRLLENFKNECWKR